MAYIGNTPGVSSQRLVTSFTATASQTTFTPTNGYVVGYIDVYYNGVKLIVGDDYTASNGVTVVLATPAAAGDSVELVAYLPRGLSDGYTKIEADARYAQEGANTDITSISGITGGVGTPDYVDFDTAATITPAVGRLGWDADNGSLQMGMAGGNVSTHVGQTMHAYVTNAESVTINKGQPVYLYQAQGDRATVKLAGNTSDATSAKTLGLAAENIAAGQIGYVICQGVLNNVDTSAFNAGDTLYLGATVGTLTATKPVAPNHLVYIGVVERANAGAGQIYVRPQNGYELDEIHDVLITSEVDGQVLTYESATGLWKNKTVATALGFTPENVANKGVANGYASLDGSGKVPSTQLPSYVDDVLEYANLATFPATGETGKIYVTLDTNKTYRWSGSAYVEIASSPGSTDAVTEGTTNLYFTQARARTSVSASGSLSYNSSTGVFSFTDAVTSVAGKTGVVTLTNSDVGLGNVENKSSATIRGELTSANVTTALGYTPPQPTGTGASGTWGISISGNAATATTASNVNNGTLTMNVSGTGLSGSQTFTANQSGNATFTVTSNATSANTLSTIVARDSSTGGFTCGDITATRPASPTTGVIFLGNTGTRYLFFDGTNYQMPNGQLGVNGQTVLNAGNYNSYAPTLTGTGASGTWGIAISGNAASATTINSVAQNLGYSLNSTVSYVGQGGPQILGQGGAAMMSFHRPGAYAVNFGLDSDNVLKVGGWSMGGASYVIIHSGNISNYSSGGSLKSQTFTGSGTFTVPAGITSVWVTMVGGGGSGGSNASSSGSSGGGGGAYCLKRAVSVTPGAGVAVTIGGGGGGVNNSDGNDGGASSFGSVSVSGGLGGPCQSTFSMGGAGGGNGGVAIGTNNASGRNPYPATGPGGRGGKSDTTTYWGAFSGGGGGLFGDGTNGSQQSSASAGANTGAGSGGASNGAWSSGNGGSGMVIVEWLG